MANKHDMAVFICRVQPFHNGHKHIIQTALDKADFVTVLIGSANSPRRDRNPFTFAERKDMIKGAFSGNDRERIIVLPLSDDTYNDTKWVKNVQTQVEQGLWYAGLAGNTPAEINKNLSIKLIGHSKDHTSYYLKLFPQWGDGIEVENYNGLNSTDIRNVYFSAEGRNWLDSNVVDATIPPNVKNFLKEFILTVDYQQIKSECEFIADYKHSWRSAPWPVTFVTVDAVVVQSGHILLVKRRALPGKGLWAMPGGFINQNERIIDAVVRELREETKIKVPDPVLYGSIVEKDVFDDPKRSSRGRTITHAFLIRLRDDVTLPKVKGADDAEKAKWVPIAQLKEEDFFEDHYHIIMNMVGRIKK